MVLKILAYSRVVDELLYSSSRKNGLVPHAGYLKDTRAKKGTSRENNFLIGVDDGSVRQGYASGVVAVVAALQIYLRYCRTSHNDELRTSEG